MSGRGQTERSILVWSAAGLLAALLLPWYGLQEGLAGVNWVAGLWSSEDYAGGIAEIFAHGKWWLAPTLAALVVCIAIGVMPMKSFNASYGSFLYMCAVATKVAEYTITV